MKIRKGLLAAATAATVSISGMTVPAFAQDDTNAVAPSSTTGRAAGSSDEANALGEVGEKIKAGSSDKDGNWDPKKISAWIGVFTALLTAVGALITFLDKNFDIKF
ncbi:hypothetical protein [Corynebacterium sp. CCUG 70398]|uniref:hypothetical protein n=1 Tax=Corynebacterium sp. CCUG 70398 TaxID=2823891 RepID=UPI00210D3895|nr:hypothetical protein [Corynebacterium sp. CCUG 70398]MCQ4622262.1 hypothetical protein [Corynebacterium sp. CCUG 70398]